MLTPFVLDLYFEATAAASRLSSPTTHLTNGDLEVIPDVTGHDDLRESHLTSHRSAAVNQMLIVVQHGLEVADERLYAHVHTCEVKYLRVRSQHAMSSLIEKGRLLTCK